MNNQSSISRAFSAFKSSPTTLIRSAFGLEASLFGLVSAYLLLDTEQLLQIGFSRNTAFVTPLAIWLTRMWGSNALALCLPLAWGASANATPRERRLVYWTMFAADVAAAATDLGMLACGTDTGLQSGLNLQLVGAQLIPMCWRAWCLFVRPDWFGDEHGSEKSFEPDRKG
jgi:hypothetical protein